MMGKPLKLLVLVILCVASTAANARENTHKHTNNKKSVHKPVSKTKTMSINKRKPVRMPTSKAKPMSMNKHKQVRMPTKKKKPASVTKRTIPPLPGPTPELRDTPTPTRAGPIARSMSFINIILASTPKILPNACASQYGDCWGQKYECCQGLYCNRNFGFPNEPNFCVTTPKPTLKPTPKPAQKPTPNFCATDGDYCPGIQNGQRYDCCQGLFCDYEYRAPICVSTNPPPCNNGGVDECCPNGDCCPDDGVLCCFGDCCDDEECNWCEARADGEC